MIWMKNSRLAIFILLFGISLFSLISNFKVFDVNVLQHRMLTIVASGNYVDIADNYLNRISTNYPTLSQTAIPFKVIRGAYWVQQTDSVQKGISLLKKSNKENPYLGYTDLIFANLYEALGNKDSFNYYARAAHRKLPNAPQHYVLLSKVLVNEDKIDSLKILFDQIKNRVDDRQIYQVYLAAVLKNQDNLDSMQLVEDAKLAKSKFPGIEGVNLLSDYIIYGEDKVNETIMLKQKAIDSFDTNPKYSINTMKQVVSNIGDDITNYEVLIEMYFRQNDYNNVINLFNELSIKKMTTLRTPVIEFISISYVNTNDIQSGCNLARTLRGWGYKLSSSLAIACRINQ